MDRPPTPSEHPIVAHLRARLAELGSDQLAAAFERLAQEAGSDSRTGSEANG